MKYVIYLSGLPVNSGIVVNTDIDLLDAMKHDKEPSRIVRVSRYSNDDTVLRISSIAMISPAPDETL